MNSNELWVSIAAESPAPGGTGDGMAFSCLRDGKRTKTLMQIIERTLPKSSSVVDLGAGTGILGFYAAECGAADVTLVEVKPELANFARSMALKLGYTPENGHYRKNGTTLHIQQGDACHFTPERNPDAVICEMVETGLIEEFIVPAMYNMRRHTSPNALFYPGSASLQLQLAGKNASGARVPLSLPVEYFRCDFKHSDERGVDVEIEIPIEETGSLTHGNLLTTLDFPGGHTTGIFTSLCHPQRIDFANSYFQEPLLPVRSGDVVRVQLAYNFCCQRDFVHFELLGKR